MPKIIDPEYLDQPLELPAATRNGVARAAALESLHSGNRTPTSLISYASQGSVLIVGAETDAVDMARSVAAGGLRTTMLVPTGDPGFKQGESEFGPLLFGPVTGLRGHLGSFEIVPGASGAPKLGLKRNDFDLVIDLGTEKLVTARSLPIGYFAPASDADRAATVDQVSELVGEFEKPKFFGLDPNICAHTANGIVGCTRCIDVCPTESIQPASHSVEVDPYRCQGIGICATACPSGAITYAFPMVSDLLDDLRRTLHGYHDAKGGHPVLLFHDSEQGREWLAEEMANMPENLIPVEVEDVASIGLDAWLSVLAYGAHQVLLMALPDTGDPVIREIRHQIDIADTILGALGYDGGRIQLLRPADRAALPGCVPESPSAPLAPSAGFAAFNEKRTTLKLALEHFQEYAAKSRQSVKLPIGAPFGRVKVDKQTCTLCMACVSACPASALGDGQGLPKLMFTEANCVQCGLCVATCPEDALELEPRFNFVAETRDRPQVLHEEAPFNCVSCGKPFATQSMMGRMREKLKDHWMYQDAARLRRLEMCEDCRIADMYAQEGNMENPYKSEV